jgi:hypothetical protein
MVKKFIESIIFKSPPEDVGEVYLTWEFPEVRKYERSRRWYVVAAVVVLALVAYSIWTVNFFLPIIILLAAFIIIFEHYQPTKKISVRLSEDGVVVGDSFYPFEELRSYWFAYQPPIVKKLYIDFKSGRRSLGLPLEETNPLMVREILDQVLKENLKEEDERLDEAFARLLKLH